MKRTLLKELAESVREKQEKDPHLNLEELRAAVFEEGYTDRIVYHLESCRACRRSLEYERRENPIYLLMKEYEVKGLSKEEFWKAMDEVWDGFETSTS